MAPGTIREPASASFTESSMSFIDSICRTGIAQAPEGMTDMITFASADRRGATEANRANRSRRP